MDRHETEIHDPLNPLLDEALGAESIEGGYPAQLTGRIVAQTRDQLPRRRGVLATISSRRLRTAAAAAILFAEAGIWATIIGIANDAQALVTAGHVIDQFATVEQLGQAPLDEHIDHLRSAVNRFGGSASELMALEHELSMLEQNQGGENL